MCIDNIKMNLNLIDCSKIDDVLIDELRGLVFELGEALNATGGGAISAKGQIPIPSSGRATEIWEGLNSTINELGNSPWPDSKTRRTGELSGSRVRTAPALAKTTKQGDST